MAFINLFKNSAKELKSIQCLTVTGVLVAVYVVLNSPLLSFNTEMLKITFGYLALAAIGMFYGPVVAMIAAIPCDIVAAMVNGLGINPVYTIPKILEGLIYGIFLYGYAVRGMRNERKYQVGWIIWQITRIVIARLIVISCVYLLLNSILLYYMTGISSNTFTVFMTPRITKNIIQFPVDLALMFAILPILAALFNKVKARYRKER